MIGRVGVFAMVALLVGCGIDVEEVCEDLDEACSEVRAADCRRDGEALEKLSDDVGCSDAFEAYLDCIDEASCGYTTACEEQVIDLEACGIQLTAPD